MNWEVPFLWASRLTGSPADAARLANLAIARELIAAESMGPSPSQGIKGWRNSVMDLALSGPPAVTADPAPWKRLREAAAGSAASARDADGTAHWVEAFQRSGPHRKARGAYATPLPLAAALACSALRAGSPPRVLDPAAGTGSLLLAAQRVLLPDGSTRDDRRRRTLSLYGAEIDPDARELACLLLWIGAHGDVLLEEIAARVVADNALTKNWWAEEPFDAVVMNPPWESLRHARSDETLGTQRRAVLERLRAAAPGADDLPPLFTRQGRGDYNLYKMFVELAPHLLAENGRLAALIPSAFASDLGMSELRKLYLSEMRIERWTSFENLSGYFSIDSRYKFAIMQAVRDRSGTGSLEIRPFASSAREVEAPHVVMSRPGLLRLGGPSEMILEISSARELAVLERMFECGTPLLGAAAAFGHVSYRREVDLTLDRARGRFVRTDECALKRVSADGIFTIRRNHQPEQLVPLIEGRMVSHYDFFAKSWIAGSGRTARWTHADRRRLQDCRPQFLIQPLAKPDPVRVALCDVTSATNTRTVMAAWVPPTWTCGNTAPTLRFDSPRLALAATAVLNSMTFDWLTRRVVSGLHLNKFYLESLVWPRVAEDMIDALAGEALSLLLASSRFMDLGVADELAAVSRKAGADDYVESHVAIERIVASGFGLTTSMLAEVLGDRPADRRGLWRHFTGDPRAGRIRAALVGDHGPGSGAPSGPG